MLWLWTLAKAYGMIDFGQTRYDSMEKETKSWSKKKSFEENTQAMGWNGNPGRAFEPGVIDFDKLFSKRKGSQFDSQNDKIKTILPEAHAMLTSKKKWSDEEKKEKGWEDAYSLVTSEEFPGAGITIPGVLLQNLTRGMMGAGGGPKSKMTKKFSKEAEQVRKAVAS